MFRLDGKRAVVTGAGRGIGRAIAEALVQQGAAVAVTELPDRLDAAQQVARAFAGVALPLDLRDLASIRSLFEDLRSHWGGLDVLVNNAGVNIPQPALEVTEEAWDAVLDTNLKGLFFASQAAARLMLERGGRIVNIASQMGLVGYHKRAAYCSSKAGVVNLTRQLAFEWARHRILVNAVAPTFIETELTASTLADSELKQDILSRIPLARLGVPDDVAGAVVFLASDEARLITGHTLVVDGGWTAR